MKKHFYFLFCALALILSACSEELNGVQNNDQEITTIHVSARNFESSTRTAISKEGYSVRWGDKDIIGIFPMVENSKQIAFELSGGKNDQEATFDGRGWGLMSNTQYAAYYPVLNDVTLDKTNITLDYTGQKQTANGSTGNLGDYDFLVATSTSPSNGSLSFEFQHVGSLMHLVLDAPDGNYSKVELHTDGDFYAKAILNLETGEILPDEESKTKTLTLDLDDVSVTNGKLEIFTMVYPVDLEDHNIYAYAYDEEGNNRATEAWNGANLKSGTILPVTPDSESAVTPYLTFKADQAQTLQMSQAVETLQYSVNGGEWQVLGTNTVSFGGSNGDLRLRGKSSIGTAISSSSYSTIKFENSNPVYCSGDIRTLVDYENYSTASTDKAIFQNLFKNCTALVSAPELPATTLQENCYYGMFSGCTNLTKAPELPATTLANRCYSDMFYGCANLIEAPTKLPATTVPQQCYEYMFSGCINLTKAPELPATNLSAYCYSRMFERCSNLTEAPELPATILANDCYSQMFYKCKKLTKAPELQASTLANASCFRMFQECSIKELPAYLQNTALVKTWLDRNEGLQGLFAGLPVTDDYLHAILPHNESGKYYLPGGDYSSMFEGCTLLKTAPELPATTLEDFCYNNMFSGCTSLTEAPTKLPAMTLTIQCYGQMFYGCTSLTEAPQLPAMTLKDWCYYNMFAGCTSLTKAPELPATTLKKQCYSRMFHGCTSLKYIKMMAIDYTESCLSAWTYNVASTGTFVKNAAATWDENGVIPSGWTVETATK